MKRTGIPDSILEQPDAPLILKKVDKILKEEGKHRRKFRKEVKEYDKAEFINGQILIQPPASKKHNTASGNLYNLLSAYSQKNDLGYLGHDKVMISLTRNDYEPDICFFEKEKAVHLVEDQTLFPVPDLIVEVLSVYTFKRDRGMKFQDYEAHGVPEYWIVDPDEKKVEQFFLENNEYVLKNKAGFGGKIYSNVILGFNTSVKSLFESKAFLKSLKSILLD